MRKASMIIHECGVEPSRCCRLRGAQCLSAADEGSQLASTIVRTCNQKLDCQMSAIKSEGPLSLLTSRCISRFTLALATNYGDFAERDSTERELPASGVSVFPPPDWNSPPRNFPDSKDWAENDSTEGSSARDDSSASDVPSYVPETEKPGYHLPESVETQLRHQKSRFHIWSATVGARDIGTTSLEYKLRDASDIRGSVLNTMDDLAQLLQDLIDIVKGEVVPWDQVPGEENGTVDGEAPVTELEQITLHIKEVVESLWGLSAAIQHPAPHDFNTFLAANTLVNEMNDLSHVRESYPKLLHWQAEKLAGALLRARQYLRYRSASPTKPALDVSQGQDRTGKRKVPSTSESPRSRASTLGNPSLSQSDRLAEPQETLLQSDAPSAGQRCMPQLPREASFGPFECPMCCCVVFLQDEIKWK